MGHGPHLKGKSMSNDATEIATLTEIKTIPGLIGEITAFLTPGTLEAQAQELNEAYSGLTIAGHVDGEAAGLEAVKTALNQKVIKFRTAIEGEHRRLKAPFWNAGKELDKRKTEAIALAAPLEARLKKEIEDHEAKLALIAKQDEERRKALVNARLQFAMQHGIVVDATDAEQMPEDEWQVHCGVLLAEKEIAEGEERRRAEAQRIAQARIIGRMELAGKLGQHLSREDAEYLTDEEWEALADGWRSDKEARDREQANLLEIKSLKDRASAQGFLLIDQDIAGWEDREASFMLWMAEKVKTRQKEQADRQKQDWLLERTALLKDGENVSVKVLMEATPDEWSVIYRQILEERDAKKVPVQITAPAMPVQDAPTYSITHPVSHPAADNKQEALSICKDFAAFGKSLPSEELKAALRPIYNRMKLLAEAL